MTDGVLDTGAFAEARAAGRVLIERLRQAPPSGHLDDQSSEIFYGVGYGKLAAKQYEDAAIVFGMLVAVRPTEARFLSGLAHSLRGLGDAETAATLFSLAGAQEPGNPGHYFALVDLLLEQGDRALAKLVLQSVVAYTTMQDELADAQNRAQAMLDLLDKSG